MKDSQRLKVGIDIGRSTADFVLLHPEGNPLETHRTFSNSPAGMEQAKGLLLKTMSDHQLTGVDIAVEATSYYWLPAYIALAQDNDLARCDPRLLVLNAAWVKWYKKSFSPDHKSDQRDPFYIADRLRTLIQPTWWEYDPHWLSLRFLTRFRFHLSKSLVREKNHYQLFLFLAHSAYSRKSPFSDTFSRISMILLHTPGLLEEIEELSVDDLAVRLDELSTHQLKNSKGTAERLKLALQESFTLPKDLEPSIQVNLNCLQMLIEGIQAQIKVVDQEIAKLVKNDYPEVAWLASIPGIGSVYSSGIAAEIGNIDRFAERQRWDKKKNCYRNRTAREIEDAVAKFAGLWWAENASGDFQAEETHMSKRGNSHLRYFILEAADCMRLYIPSYADYYAKKYKQATKHHHKRALVLTGRKAIGLIVGLLYHHEFYAPEEVHPHI